MARRSMQRRMGAAPALEAFTAGWLARVLFVVAGVPASTANLAGFAVLGALLLEGSAYWTLKRRQLRAGARCPSGLTVLRALRRANVVVLAGHWWYWRSPPRANRAWRAGPDWRSGRSPWWGL